jgi:hypothetical protein
MGIGYGRLTLASASIVFLTHARRQTDGQMDSHEDGYVDRQTERQQIERWTDI